ncbi:PREDICTED: E3 ubiquitin-protein ligase RNF213-like [Amphimedon queenslandica]|uniref:UBA domain-containing protein n=1 Tax=Amphimedon queenslandica TaxID=400682 RepID=A0AAN0J885_AMPQE|nr:PREDICTED: E3 ubiquitin-protein ligase RNF213-like [Amphimedon queenslandica]|eukprot:XP_019853235.1 PREDICTED: E3 ubiquitin-protein ligase RNF213-like [Amphimedon queenslandica]
MTTIVFHALLPLSLWEFDDTSRVCIRFGSNKLGSWQCDVGPCEINICSGIDDMREVTLKVKIGSNIVSDGVPYKYCVYSPKTKSVKDAQYEHIVADYGSYPNEYNNRFIKVPATIKDFHQYDTVIYRSLHSLENQEKIRKVASSIVNILFGQPETTTADIKDVKLPTMIETRSYCLQVYLADVFKNLQLGCVTHVEELISHIDNVYDCLYVPLLHNERTSLSTVTREWKCNDLKHNLKQTLLALAHDLNKNEGISSDKRMIVATVIICCLRKIGFTDISEDETLNIFSLLTINFQFERRECQELHSFLEMLKIGSLKTILLFLEAATSYIVRFKATGVNHRHLILLFNFVSLMHFIQGHTKPFECLDQSPEQIQWHLLDDAFSKIRPYMYKTMDKLQSEELKTLHSDLQKLFLIDPLLLPIFIQACSLSQCKALFRAVSPFYSVSNLAFRFQHSSSITNNTETIVKLLALIHSHVDHSFNDNKHEGVQQLNYAVQYLMKGTITEFLKPVPFPVIFASVMALYLKALSMALMCSKNPNILDEGLGFTNETVNNWVTGIIGGDMFGNDVTRPSGKYLLKQSDEFEVWQHIFLIACPENVSQSWQYSLCSIVDKRLSKVPSHLKADILQFAENNQVHPLLLQTIVDNLCQSLDDLIFSDGQSYTDSLKKLQDSKHMTKIMEDILKKKYRNKDKLSIYDILEWDIWPGFIRIYVAQLAFHKEGLSDKDQEICYEAITIFNSVCMAVLEGSITYVLLCELDTKRKEVQKLCEAIGSRLDAEKLRPFKNISFTDVISTLEVRLKEYKTFQQTQKQIFTLFEYLNGSELIIPELADGTLIVADVSERPISSLCETIDNKIVCHYFAFAAPVFPILFQFTLLTKIYHTNTFQKLWYSQVNQYKGKILQCSDVVNLIWNPVFIKLRQFLQDLKSLTISLVSVEQLLQEYSCNHEKINTELLLLEEGVSMCMDKKSDITWIDSCVKKMLLYHSLHQTATAAKIFLELKNVLALTGDFNIAEKLAAKFMKDVKDQTLQCINNDLVSTVEFLQDISSNPKKLECLKMFIDCHGIIEWIKSVTSDVQDLQHFVTIALATASAGEDDYTRDRLSNLRTVGSGFAKLIYSLPKSTGCIELVRCCTSLWDTLKRDAALPTKLRDCSEQIEWYKLVKEMQGSVENSSFGQMNNITKYGIYTVGSHAKGAQLKPSELIKMHLEQRDKPLAQLKYSLDELRDLESKLVLITGRESKERANVDYFLKVFNTVCHITDVLIQLLQHGHSKYMEWVLRFPCTLPCGHDRDLVDLLTDILNNMTIDLEEWQGEVAEARNQFYCLNYYTTQQLLLLRKELSHFTDHNYCGDLKPDVLALLQSLSKDISHQDPHKVVTYIREIFDNWDEENEDSLKLDPSIDESYLPDTAPNESREADIIASKLHSSSVPYYPQLTSSDLTQKQSVILDNLVQSFGFSEKLILLAFERVAKPDIEEAVEGWCIEHEEDYVFDEEEIGDVVECPTENNDDIENLLLTPGDYHSTKSQVVERKILVRVREMVPVDREHPMVKDMILSGYSPEQALEAVEKYPDNIDKAMEYIDNLCTDVDDHELFPETVLSSLERQQSTGSYACDIEIVCDPSIKSFLTLEKLAKVLERLNCKYAASVTFERNFGEVLKKGEPNLIIVPPDNVLKTVLSLYMENKDLPLPTYEEVLICNEYTTAEEVNLLWKRAMGDPNHFRLFCLVHAELLSYQVCDSAIKSLHDFSQGNTEYKLVIVCSNEDQDKSHIVAKLQLHKRPFSLISKDADFHLYLSNHFTNKSSSTNILASVVDPENSRVRVVSSTRAGMGKSLYIQRMKEDLKQKRKSTHDINDVVIPFHGPKVTFDDILKSLKEPFNDKQDTNQACIFHFDISPNVLRQVDSVLFSLLILQAASDSQGKIWRCHETHLYAVEVTILKEEEDFAKSSITLLNLLPKVECHSPNNVLNYLRTTKEDTNIRTVDDIEFRSEQFQRVYQYLKRHSTNAPLDTFTYVHKPGSVTEKPAECLQLYLQYCGVKDPSWSELKHFVEFLNIQLKACENSVFCNEHYVGDVMSGLKTFVVKFMIRMSKDFATSSLKGEVALENKEVLNNDEQLQVYEIDRRKRWEQSYHPYLFFNKDGTSITFVGFNVSRNGDIQDPNKGNVVIERRAMTPQLHNGLRHNQVDLLENYRSWNKNTMINKIGMVMGLEWSYDPDSSYVLTIDNVIKIMAIHMRFRCNIPVIIMGETGCGKTRLIRYMCNIAAQCCKNSGSEVQNMLIMKIHGGTTENEVIKMVEKAEELASINREKHEVDTVLFFDEANTSDAIGLIKEVMCDRRINGRSIKEDVKFIAACNPYRKHTIDMINKLESAGLGFFVKATETQQKLGKTPLRQLVYRVLDLPPSMRPLVYDFGQLNDDTEKDYTFQIVNDRCSDIDEVKGQTNVIQSVAHVLAWSQKYMRERNDECSFVSLRDVERAMLVFRHFCRQKDHFREKVSKKAEEEEEDIVQCDIARSLILAISVCYHARLQDRVEYETNVVQEFKPPLTVTGREQFCNEIRWCQDILLDNMKLGPNIARNAALRENVFMMAICIELRIPLFLVGKPGSSKSLAKSIVADSMIGRLSDNEFIRGFKEVHMFSYQCSQLSTPESVIEIFNTAKGFQKKEDVKNYVSVVVLDEVGLAEDSPNLPLKALHPLLEDGTEGADGKEQIIDRNKRVAFIGISNWALDPAKMNRGVMVTRGDPDVDELVLSAKGICSNETNDPIKEKLSMYFHPLASAYKDICEEQDQRQKPFFGLRDFYSLIKMLYWMCKKSDRPLTDPQLQHAIKRNFGGLDVDEIDTYGIFKHYFKDLEHKPDLRSVTNENLKDILVPDNSPLGLIRKSLQTREVSWHGENRYLLFLTENYAALQVIKHYLHEEVGLREVGIEDDRAEGYSLEASLSLVTDDSLKARSMEHKMKPFVLFGSSFPKDREYTQVCRNINQIKICMETGRTVILLNLENLYESLYDLLNQYYIHHGDQRYVDLGLQTHRVKCRVHHNFKLILIAEKATVYRKFPTPLINRLEKHFVLSETVLLEWQKEVLKNLIEWIDKFGEISTSDSKFTKQDAFIGYQSDTPASVIFQATHEIQQEGRYIENEVSDELQEAVLECGKKMLLQMASPEALIRLKSTSLEDEQKYLSQIYYFDQHHGSIVEFLNYHLHKTRNLSGLLIQVTTHSHLLSKHEANELYRSVDIKNGGCHLLQEFDTEMNFSHKISPSFSDKEESLLIIQCDSGHLYGDLLACARYRIDDEREKNKMRHKTGEGITHVLFIVHLPRQIDATNSSFVGFQGGSWISAHIDDIRPPLDSDLTLDDAQNAPISHLFYNGQFLIDEEMEIELKEDSDLIESEEEVMEDNQSLARSQSDNEEEDMSGNAVVYDDGLKVEDLEELSSDDVHADDMQNSISEKSDDAEVPASKKQHSQCSRLYNCIQAAVASLIETGDSRKQTAAAMRVKILLKHIPPNPSFPLDTKTFYGALVKHLRSLLQEREEKRPDICSEWVLNEALSGKKLQSGGTFQNVLSRKLDEVITPIFAAVLLFVDQYSNLNLLEHSNEYLKTLWHAIFSNEEVIRFSFQNYTLGLGISYQVAVPGMGQTLAAESEFDCEFPFFWLIKEAIESKWETVRSSSDDHRQNVHVRLCDMLHDDPVANVLMRVPQKHWSELCLLYLNDVLRSVHNAPHHKASDEYEILKNSLIALINGPDLSPHKSLLSFLAAVHVVYNEYQKDIMWFGQLTAHSPGILLQLAREDFCDCQYFKLPLYAVKVSISPDNLALPLTPEKRGFIRQRLVKLQLCQNSIDSILTLAPNNEFTQEIRITWQCVRAVQLFIEHVALKCSQDENDQKFITFVQYANRINVRLKCEFVKLDAILIVKKVLQTVDREAKSKLKFTDKMKEMLRECCKSYFMEVVSSLCFGQATPPEPDLISELLNIVITEQNKTKEFTYSEEEKADKVPVIRSFLLQLLLEHNMEEVKQHLSSYFEKAQHLIQNDHNLCLLCIQCLEDAIYKQHGQFSLQMKVEKALSTIEQGKELISGSETPYPGEEISLEYLEGVSMLRFSLSVIAELIHYQYSNKETEEITYTHHSQLLLNKAKECCSDDHLNEDDTGPGVFLLKQIGKQYGVAFLTNLTSDATMQWVVPRSLRQSDDEDTHQVNDPFVIYDGYDKFQTILTDAVYGKDLTQLQATIQSLATADVVPLLVGTYQVITGSAVFTADSKIISDNIKKEVLATIKQCEGLKRELLWIAQHLIEDTYYGRLEVMTLRPGMSPQNRLLTDLVTHVAIAVQCTSNKLLTPFIQMISRPGDLKDCFLPTMPDDSLPDVRNAVGGGKFYECPRGHPYFVSECGKPLQQYACPICHSRIGGQNHTLESTNRIARTTDITETGYALGQPHQRESMPSTERSLSVPACAIIRALMHSSLLWTSCTNEHSMNNLLDLIKTPVAPNNVSLFFWQHLSYDIKMLSASLGKSEDDACLILHILLKNIATLNPRGGNATNLSSKEHRREWEKSFHDLYIKPVLTNLDANLHKATDLILNHKKEERDRLFYVIHERVQIPPNVIVPHLWSYHSRITLKNVLQVLQAEKETYPILYEFLIQDQFLRATQYLPSIIKLQQQMYKMSHKKLDKKEATQWTIRDYLKGFRQPRGTQGENKRNQFQDRLNCVIKAWNLVKERLKDARVHVDPNIIQSLSWDEKTPLSYLIPTLTGDGACTVALVGLLVGIHNDFLEKCHSQLETKLKKNKSKMCKVPASQIQLCHLLDYEHQILSIVLSHCHYSLKHGKGHDVNYDFAALEKHIVDRFIHGKPYIQLEFPQVVYRKDVYTAEAFANIRKNVQPQRQLTVKQQTDIVHELHSMKHLRECLDVVEIVIGFLSSGKSNSKTELKTYIKRVVRIDEKRFTSKKAMEYCTLGHILSLWETLSVQMAKCLTIRNQEAFDSFGEELMKNLSKEQVENLKSYLKGIDVPPFLNLLYEFIETTVRHYESNYIGITWSLSDTLYLHLENSELEYLLPEDFQKKFPKSITVDQTVEVWKTIVMFQYDYEQKIA